MLMKKSFLAMLILMLILMLLNLIQVMLILMLFYESKVCPCAVLRPLLAPESLMFYISALLLSFPCLSLSKNHELTEVFIKNKENNNFLSDGFVT